MQIEIANRNPGTVPPETAADQVLIAVSRDTARKYQDKDAVSGPAVDVWPLRHVLYTILTGDKPVAPTQSNQLDRPQLMLLSKATMRMSTKQLREVLRTG